MHFLSILAIVKNEDDFIKEFVEFYKLQGVDHFYIYDNESDISLKKTLKDYLSICTINEIKGDIQQINAYNNFLKNHKYETEWVAVFDIDEFVLTKKHHTLKEFILANSSIDCISINWVIFGNGKHIKKPLSGLIIENYLYSEGKQHLNVKSITKTSAIKKFTHPHFPELKWFKKHTNAAGNIMKGAENKETTTDIIQLNHYFTKSLEEYQLKLNSKRADNGQVRLEIKEDMKWLPSEAERCSVHFDNELNERFGKLVKKALASQN